MESAFGLDCLSTRAGNLAPTCVRDCGVRWIDNDEQVDAVLEDLKQATTFFIDTEFESTRKRTRLSVIQVGRGEEIYLLDALALTRLREVGEIMVRDDVRWVLHAGNQDVELLLESFRQPKPPSLFDTQVAWALTSLEGSVSLAYLQYRMLGVRTMKTHQADDWIRRPLPRSQLEYAANDIRYLPQLYEKLSQRLTSAGRAEIVSDVCYGQLWPTPEAPEALTLKSFRHAWQLAPRNQAALRYLIEWYNEQPNWEKERGPQTKTLVAIASRLPKTPKDLMRIKGMPPHFATGYADTLVRGVGRATRDANADEFEQIEPVPYLTRREIEVDAWLTQLRAEVSLGLEVAPELCFPLRIQRAWRGRLLDGESAGDLPASLDGWRAKLLAEATQAFIASKPLPATLETQQTDSPK